MNDEVLYFENMDLTNIVTLVKSDRLIQMVKESKYDKSEIAFFEVRFEKGSTLSIVVQWKDRVNLTISPLRLVTKCSFGTKS